MRERERGEKEEGKRESWEREPHGYRRPEVGLPWREAPSNPPQMLSSTSSWSDVSARATTREHVVLEPVGDHRVAARMLLACAYIRSARVTREKKKKEKREREKKEKTEWHGRARNILRLSYLFFPFSLSNHLLLAHDTRHLCGHHATGFVRNRLKKSSRTTRGASSEQLNMQC